MFYGDIMDLKKLETFIYVAEQSSFTKAAEKLGYTQSAVSFQIKELEKELNTALFERINHNIKLTPKGREILSLAHKMIAVSDEIKKAADDTSDAGVTIRIAMADSLCHFIFWNNFSSFNKQYPNIRLEIILTNTQEMFRLAKRNNVDLVFTLDKHIYDTNYVIEKEYQVNTSLIVSPENEIADKEEVSIENIRNVPMILTEKGMSYRQVFEDYAARNGLPLEPVLEIGDTDLICHLVSQNSGISFLPDFVTEDYVKCGKLKRLKLKDFSPEIWIQMLYHHDKWITPQMRCVIDYLCSFM